MALLYFSSAIGFDAMMFICCRLLRAVRYSSVAPCTYVCNRVNYADCLLPFSSLLGMQLIATAFAGLQFIVCIISSWYVANDTPEAVMVVRSRFGID